jgi:hypothetical protein
MRKGLSGLGLVLDVLLLVASLGTGGPVVEGVRVVAVVVAAMLGALVVFVGGVFAVALVGQKQPPYPMQ